MKSNKKDQEEQEQTRHFDAMAQFWREFVNQGDRKITEIQENNYSYQQYVEDKKNQDNNKKSRGDKKL